LNGAIMFADPALMSPAISGGSVLTNTEIPGEGAAGQ
jgi:hypothetical protein